MNSQEIVSIVIVCLIVIVGYTILFVPYPSGPKVSSVNCYGDFCTVYVGEGLNAYSFTSPRSAINYRAGDCLFFGRPACCDCGPKNLYESLFGKGAE
jgi:hypothetical protein